MKEYIRLTIEELALRRAALEHQMEDIRETEGVLRRIGDEPVEIILPGTTKDEAGLIGTSPPGSMPHDRLGLKDKSLRRGPRKAREIIHSRHVVKPGKFKGVVPVVSSLQGGPTRYRASYWDGKTKKNQSVGTFTDELEAALAVAKGLGDESEIQRISDLINQRRNNPTKPVKKPPATGSKKIRQPKLTHYKGVKLSKPLVDGTQQYEVNVFLNGRVKYLGRFKIEEEAAAVAAEARGEKAEAKRLRELVKQKAADEQEQRENNPERQANRDEDPPDKTPQVWECKNCFKQYIQAEPPPKCLECSHIEFRPID